MALYVGDNEISQKILLKGNVGVQLPTMSSDTEGQYLSNDGIQPVWKDEQIGYKQISNCITEIPQDIKLELNSDHTITLKAGSKLYKPDGTFKITNIDISMDFKEYGTSSEGMICITVSDGMNFSIIENITSGTIPPSLPVNKRLLWFDTDTKIIKMYAPNSSEYEECYLPLGICNVVANTSCTIKQIFNGFSYIGNTIFKNGGNTYIFPNGKNDDGNQKNIVKTLSNLTYWTISLAPNTLYTLFVRNSTDNRQMEFFTTSNVYYQNDAPTLSSYSIWYSPIENKWRYTLSNISNGWLNDWVVCKVGTFLTDNSGNIISFNFSDTISLIDRNDSSWIAQQAMPSKKAIPLTLGASGATYVAPANGYFSIDGQGPTWVDVAITNTELNYGYCYASRSSDKYLRTLIPVSKGNTCQILFDTAFTNLISFNFIYAEGEL